MENNEKWRQYHQTCLVNWWINDLSVTVTWQLSSRFATVPTTTRSSSVATTPNETPRTTASVPLAADQPSDRPVTSNIEAGRHQRPSDQRCLLPADNFGQFVLHCLHMIMMPQRTRHRVFVVTWLCDWVACCVLESRQRLGSSDFTSVLQYNHRSVDVVWWQEELGEMICELWSVAC